MAAAASPLHLDLFALGAVVGAVTAAAVRPGARIPALVTGAAAAVAVGQHAGAPSSGSSGLLAALAVVTAALAGAALAGGPLREAVGRAVRDRPAAATWILALGTVAAGLVYLSVPDTEAAVALGGYATAATAGTAWRRRSIDATSAGALGAAMVAAVVAALWAGAGPGRTVTPLGWWPVKVVAVATMVVAAVWLTRRRARPPR